MSESGTRGRGGPMSAAGLAYAWRELARRAGLPDDEIACPCNDSSVQLCEAAVPVLYGSPTVRMPRPGVIVVPCRDEAWQEHVNRSPDGRVLVPAVAAVPSGVDPPFDDQLPVPFWGRGCRESGKPFAERRADGSVVFYADVLAAAFFMLTRWEETVAREHDSHERFPATASVAFRDGYLGLPVVDMHALVLRSWLEVLLPGWRPAASTFSVVLSHDIDHLQRFRGARAAVAALAVDALKVRSARSTWETTIDIVRPLVDAGRDAYMDSIVRLARIAEEQGIAGEFLFMASETGPYSSGYDPGRARQLVEALLLAGHRVGFHAGYDTLGDEKLLATERRRLEEALGHRVNGGRQHYLRFRVPDTWRDWEAVGLEYDSTVGYSEHEGFRCGTCHPYHPFDIQEDRRMEITEVPLVVMDATLKRSRQLTPEQAEERIVELARICRRAEGTLTLLWHNSSFRGEWRTWGAAYESAVRRLGELC